MRLGFSGPRIGFVRPWVSFRVGGAGRQSPSSSGSEFVYVIRREDNGHHKVGHSGNPERRLADLQTGSSTRLALVWQSPVAGSAYAVEQEAHAILNAYRLEGEWFDIQREAAIGAIYGAASRLSIPLDEHVDGAYRPRFVDTFLGKVAFVALIFALIFIAQATMSR